MILGFFGCLFLFCCQLFVSMYLQIKYDDDDDDDDDDDITSNFTCR